MNKTHRANCDVTVLLGYTDYYYLQNGTHVGHRFTEKYMAQKNRNLTD